VRFEFGVQSICSPLFQTADGSLDGEHSHAGCVLAYRGEVDMGESGELAVVISDYRQFPGNRNPFSPNGIDDTDSHAIIGGDDSCGPPLVTQQFLGRADPRVLGVITGNDPNLGGEPAPAHCGSIASAPLGSSCAAPAVDVHYRAMTQFNEMVDGQAYSDIVGGPDGVDAVVVDVPPDRDKRPGSG
jgi:hypothetical protein